MFVPMAVQLCKQPDLNWAEHISLKYNMYQVTYNQTSSQSHGFIVLVLFSFLPQISYHSIEINTNDSGA